MTHLNKWRSRTVLVVDDATSNRMVAVEMLRELGITSVLEAENGIVALELIESSHVDLVLTDLNMPGMDGIELLSSLAKRRDNKVLYVAVMSGVGQAVLDTVQNIADESHLELLGVFPKPLNIAYMQELLSQYDPDNRESISARSALAFSTEEVARALAQGQLVAYYQPKVFFSNRKIWGMEALVRWIHPVHGVLPPVLFVEHLESGDLALDFFRYLLRQVCAFLKSLPVQQDLVHCSINLPVPLLTTEGLVDDMVRVLKSYGLPNETIVLELTETSLMQHLAASLSALARLRMKGFGVAMDDYGTGYSSMKQLARCPFSELKIDREFVHDASISEKKHAILTSAISMCQRMGMLSVAEGVETLADWDQLSALGCEVAQGYLISRPMPEEAMREWMRTN
jgi:EAL domain-containing protein (putative c-di-GMP-specific phosphodiesterase class I)/ActR/RegA family two-component response regulator